MIFFLSDMLSKGNKMYTECRKKYQKRSNSVYLTMHFCPPIGHFSIQIEAQRENSRVFTAFDPSCRVKNSNCRRQGLCILRRAYLQITQKWPTSLLRLVCGPLAHLHCGSIQCWLELRGSGQADGIFLVCILALSGWTTTTGIFRSYLCFKWSGGF